MKLQERVSLFQTRLREVILDSGLNHSQFAESVGVDRSTMSQLLSRENLRLPRADTIASIAETYQVSIDWLLGLSQEGSLGASMVHGPSFALEDFGNSIHDSFLEWHRQALGYKVCYVPTTLPDPFKIEPVSAFEFERYGLGDIDQEARDGQLKLLQQRSEMEVCQSRQVLRSFALGEGMWGKLSVSDRVEQLRYCIELYSLLYPSFRWFLYDSQKTYSAPFSIYGPLRAVLFMGQLYVVINSNDHIRKLTSRFGQLICEAVVQPHEVQNELKQLISEIV